MRPALQLIHSRPIETHSQKYHEHSSFIRAVYYSCTRNHRLICCEHSGGMLKQSIVSSHTTNPAVLLSSCTVSCTSINPAVYYQFDIKIGLVQQTTTFFKINVRSNISMDSKGSILVTLLI